MSIVRIFGAAVIAMVAGPTATLAAYPDRPIDLICNYGPGGGADQFARSIAPLLSKELGVKVQVSNVTGAQGNNGVHSAATAKPDGYTIGTITGISVAAWLKGHGTLRAKDMTFLGIGQVTDSMLFVREDAPYKDFKQLLDAAKKNPNTIKVAISGRGGTDDVTMNVIAKQGYVFRTVPYEKPSERYASLLGGHVDVMYEEPGDVRQFMDNNQIKPIVVFSDERNPYFPKLPLVTDFGINIYLQNFRGIITGKDVSADRKEKLNAALSKVFATKEFNEFCSKTSTCTKARTIAESEKFVEGFFQRLKEHSQ